MRRIKTLGFVLCIAVAIVVVRLFFIQIVEHDKWLAKASDVHTLLETIHADRGDIYMMDHGEPVLVVTDQKVFSIVIDPMMIDMDRAEKALNNYAKDYVTVDDFEDLRRLDGVRYYIVAKNVPREVASQIVEEKISYMWFKEETKRYYPEGEFASGVLGFVNADGIGQYGVEGSLNNILAGKDGLLKTVSDINNVALSIGNDNIKIAAEDGDNVVLSIDRGLQKGVEEIAIEAVKNSSATNAAVIVMDPNTSKVLAMANVPNYDSGDYGNVKDASAYLNYTTEVPYEPASVCKPFAFSAAINEGKMTNESTYFNKGHEVIDGQIINNAEQRSKLYGTISMQTALYWSLNTGSIQALKFLGGNSAEITKEGREKLYDYYYNKFRLGKPTGIELIEAEGYIGDANEGDGRNSTYANMTFGQNLQITMIQTLTAFAATVNGGYWRTPTVVAGITNGKNIVELEREEELVEEQILSAETSQMMREMLINNRDYKVRNRIDRPGYAIGGKTGSAQVVIDGKYSDVNGETIGSYVGFGGPAGDLPKYVIMIKMWGEGQHVEGGDALLVFDSLSNYVIDYLGIKPRE